MSAYLARIGEAPMLVGESPPARRTAAPANTSFAEFPRVCRALAADSYLPRSLANRGRPLVYSQGIWVLALLAAGLLVLFGSVTDHLIPRFAIGAFLAFTPSQAGMAAHWRRVGGRGAGLSMAINGLGALATGTTTLVGARPSSPKAPG